VRDFVNAAARELEWSSLARKGVDEKGYDASGSVS